MYIYTHLFSGIRRAKMLADSVTGVKMAKMDKTKKKGNIIKICMERTQREGVEGRDAFRVYDRKSRK